MAPKVIVPVLSLLGARGQVDRGECAAYAQRARETWLDGFLVAGSLGMGSRLPERVRQELLGVWSNNVPAERLLMCAWQMGELERVVDTGARPVLVLRNLEDDAAVLRALDGLPADALVAIPSNRRDSIMVIL